jgi:type IV secretion system protein VirD4
VSGLTGRTRSGGPGSSGVGGDHTSVGRPVLDSPSDYLLAAVLVLVAVVTVGVWSTGQTAALVTGHGWPSVPVTDGLGIATRLPGHLSDPATAWPPRVRSQLPGLVGMSVAAVLDVVVLLGLAALAARWRGRGRRRRGFASPAQIHAALSPASARAIATRIRPYLTTTATRTHASGPGDSDAPSATTREPRGGAVGVLRRLRGTAAKAGTRSAGRNRVAIEEVAVTAGRTDPGVHGTSVPVVIGLENSVLVLAAPRQGKTSQVVIPWVTDWPGPAIVTSVRPDVALATAALRAERGRPVSVMDLTGTTWPDPLTWSPTTGCESFDAARRRADLLVTVGKTSGHGIGADSTNAAFFGTSATNLLAGWLHAAALTNRTMTDVLDWALDERKNDPIRLLRAHPGAAPGTAALLDTLYRSPVETRSNLWATVLTGVAPLLSETARAAFCPRPGTGFTPEQFLHRRGTIYLIVPDTQAGNLAPLISSFVDDLVTAATTAAATSPTGRLDPPLGLFLDEVANVAPLPQLPQLMSYAAGSGVFVTAVLQDIAQARARWGRDGADMLWSAATCKVVLGGLTGDEPAEISRLAGTYRETLTSHSRLPGGASLSASLSDRPVLTPDAIRTLDPALRQALILHATTPPVITRMVRHHEGPHADDHARAEHDLRARLANVTAAKATRGGQGATRGTTSTIETTGGHP